MPGLRFLVFLGSARDGRQGENIARCVVNSLREKRHEAEMIDPLTVGGDGHVRQPLHFRRDPSDVPEWMTKTNQKIEAANAVIIVTPEYNCALPPALTGIMDQFSPASYRYKPCGIVCYSMGPFGGIRAAAFARPFLSELGMFSTPKVCVIPQVQGKFSDEGQCLDDRTHENLKKVMDEVEWYASAVTTKAKAEGFPA